MLDLPDVVKKNVAFRLDLATLRLDRLLGHLYTIQKPVKNHANYLVELDTRKKEW